MAKGGPFAFRAKERKLPELIDRSCHLYPYGPPASGGRWIRTIGRSYADYAEFPRGVFLKTLETPVASRGYSVEKACAYLYLRNCCSLTRAAIVPGCDISFWPGDQICADEQDEDYKAKSKKSSEKVTAFISPSDFDPILARIVSTCMPRAHLAWMINPKKLGDTSDTRGIIKALSTALTDYRMMLTGADICSNFTIDRPPSPSTRMLGVFRR